MFGAITLVWHHYNNIFDNENVCKNKAWGALAGLDPPNQSIH